MAAEVHLEEAVLSMHVPLRLEQVFWVVGVDVRHPVRVAQHLNLAFESGNHQPSRGLGE